jgi:poly(3-hydroxybutyrate) depolymerase
MSAWGRVTERSFARMVIKPDWGIRTVVAEDGRDHLVERWSKVARPFGDLVRFRVHNRPEKPRRILLIAPMSGHYATLLRSTVASLLPDSASLWVTDWHNARDIPVSAGKFDVEDYTQYLVDFMKHLGPDTHVVAVCQPVPLALAATAILAEDDPRRAAAHADADRRPGRPRCRAHRSHRFRPPGDHGPAGASRHPARRLQV